MNNSSVNFLPDEALIHASQGGAPGIPSWLALSVLQSRNNQRESAPVAAPQGTVTQDVVAKALKLAGIQPATPQAQMQAAPQGGGIVPSDQAQAPAQSMAKGGIVSYSDGGDVEAPGGVQGILEGLGIVPKATTINPTKVTYTPGVDSDTGSIEDNASRMAGVYGQAPDYEAEQKRVQDAATKAHQSYGVGDYLTDMASGILGGKSISPTANFGAALGAADMKERGLKQQNFENDQKAEAQRLNIQGKQQERQQKIAQSAEAYHSLNAQIADSQAKAKYEADSGNAKAAQEAQEHTALLANQRAQILKDSADTFSDPTKARFFAADANSRGDKKAAQFALDAAKSAEAGLQKKSDIEQGREMAVQKARSTADMAKMYAEKAVEHKNKMEELGLATGGQGSGDAALAGGADPNSVAAGIANYTMRPLSPMSLTRPQAKAIMDQVYKINPEWNGTYYDSIQKARNDALPSGKIGGNILAYNTAISHLGLLSDYAKALGNGNIQTINKYKNMVATEFGSTAPGNFDGVKSQVAGELVSMLKKNGLPDQEAQKQAEHSLQNAKTFDQLQGIIDGQIQIGAGKLRNIKAQTKSIPGIRDSDPIFKQLDYTPEAKSIVYSRGFDPEDVSRGKVLSGVEGGNGKPTDRKIREKFKKAAGGDIEKAKRFAFDFGYRGDK